VVGRLSRVGATLVRTTHVIDTAYQRFDRLRSLLVLAFASDRLLETYSGLAYGSTTAYRADSPGFRQGLFAWERQAVKEFFPPLPARVLIGGAGGGREAFGLLELGYSCVAFEPSRPLAASMRAKGEATYAASLRAYCASYDDLPIIPAVFESTPVDLRSQAPFDAAIIGWASFSHLVDDAARVRALEQFGALTRGPILVSYLSPQPAPNRAESGRGIVNALRRRAGRRGESMFTVAMGYCRLITEADLRTLSAQAGLQIVHIDRDSPWPHAILKSRDDR
jgi:hypothetical protein